MNPIYAGKCFFIYANNNYENLITKILNGSVSPENAAVDVKSSLYILYDRANVSKKQSKEDIYNKKDVYVILNYFIYDLIKRLSEVPKKPEDVDSSVAIFNHIMMTEYFEPNYNDIPGFNNVLQKVNNDYAIIESRQEKDIAIINNKYNNVKGGWKFLKWGMSIDESNKLLIKNGMRQLFIEYPINRIDIAYGPQNDEYFDAKLTTQASSEYTSDPKYTRRWDFYFINEKLMAVSLYAGKDINEVYQQCFQVFSIGAVIIQ